MSDDETELRVQNRWLRARVENLEAALKAVVKEYTTGKDDADTAGYMAVIAERALNQQKTIPEVK